MQEHFLRGAFSLKAAFFTLGCKVNQYETEVLLEKFRDAGFSVVPFEEAADVYVVNTCTVTAVSDRKSRQMLRRAKKQNPDAVVIAAGCYPQTAKEELLKMEEIDIAVGNADKYRIVELAVEVLSKKKRVFEVHSNNEYMPYGEEAVRGRFGRTRASIKIQDGCNNFCSYCIIPYARGRVRSKAAADAEKELDDLLAAGFREIVLTGIEVCSYGQDTGEKLIDLLKRLDRKTGMYPEARLRLGSLEPRIATEEFAIALAGLKSICPQYHLALQSGCDETLKRMNRKYTTEEYRRCVSLLRKHIPDVTLTTDVMTGFPGETEAEFETTCRFVEEIGFLKVHIFPYSVRKGTKAAEMPEQVSKAVKEKRVKILEKLAANSRRKVLLSYVGKTLPVLFEEELSAGAYEGFTPNYLPVRVYSDKPLIGVTAETLLTDTDGEICLGEPT